MKRLLTVLAFVAAASLASPGAQPASANPAHHPAKATKSNKAVPAKKTRKVKTSAMHKGCPMMKGHSMHHKMMHHGRRMKCPMMGAAKHRKAGMAKH
jgi:hypothetical protein